MKRWLMISVLIIPLLVLSACGSSEQQGESEDSDNLLAAIKERGEIRIGTEGTYKPFTFRDEETNELTGYDVEVAREVAKRMGVKATFVESPWDAMLTGLSTGRFDTVANQVGVNEERKKQFDFSTPYSVSYATIVVHEDNQDIQDLEDIKGKRAGQTPTSNYGKMAEKAEAEIVSYEDMMTAMRDVAAKRIDLSLNDRLAVAEMLQTTDLPLKMVGKPMDPAESAFPVPKGNEDLVAEINKALEEMREDGTLAEISERWFGEDISKP